MILDTFFTRQNRLAESRLVICRECEHFVHATTQCKKCGCFMKFKALWANSKCPIGKWQAEND